MILPCDEIKKLIAKLQLLTISFNSDAVIFDYVMDQNISDQLLVMKLSDNQRSIMWES